MADIYEINTNSQETLQSVTLYLDKENIICHSQERTTLKTSLKSRKSSANPLPPRRSPKSGNLKFEIRKSRALAITSSASNHITCPYPNRTSSSSPLTPPPPPTPPIRPQHHTQKSAGPTK